MTVTVSGTLGAALTARRWWCRPGEPVLWALWQVDKTYRVAGCDENGYPDKSAGSRFARATGRAAASVGDAVAAGLLTAAFGGGEDSGAPGGTKRSPDLTVVGSAPDCTAMRLIRSERPPACVGYELLWVLTPHRLGVLVTRKKDASGSASAATGGIRQLGRGWGDVGRALVGKVPEKFGGNEAGEPLRGDEVASWFELARPDVVDCRPAGDTRFPERVRHCALMLADGSGFVLNARSAEGARVMVEASRG
ncbi:hypothetical protein HUO13_24825 [Saccharopolyspora erythraea]|uniref:hypothetical protein n=1 Tax=Saccharopolyspora erythraea TaxID=1836 RepID=UPI001BA7C06A|nr:hypothetical protein [Saccharopolyspora erythraea]QUH03615.1 hypothetical protein HUO13_24825 [Saccharopolyspora erythraea]